MGDKKGVCLDLNKSFELGYTNAIEAIKKHCK